MSGNPTLAKAKPTWSGKNASWHLPVQRSIGPNQPTQSTAPAADHGLAAEFAGYANVAGDFNSGNGGRTKPSPSWKPGKR